MRWGTADDEPGLEWRADCAVWLSGDGHTNEDSHASAGHTDEDGYAETGDRDTDKHRNAEAANGNGHADDSLRFGIASGDWRVPGVPGG